MMIFGIVYTALTSSGNDIVLHLNNGIKNAFELFITLVPIMCFWSGIVAVGEDSGLTQIISRILSPLTRRLFGESVYKSPAMKKISMNMSANILGMGNAATPLGLSAMNELDRLNPNPTVASHAMCMFIIINTASIQLIPSSVIALRGMYGSPSPSDILFPTLLTTLAAFTIGTGAAKICARLSGSHE